MDVADIALDANWIGSPNTFVDAMIKVRFIDPPSNLIEWYSLHDWTTHQPWASNADDRSIKAAKNQAFRWCVIEIKDKQNKDKFKDWYYNTFKFVKGQNREAILSEYESYTNGNTPLPSPPIPSPPKPKKKTVRFTPPSLSEVKDYCLERKNKIDPETFIAHYTANGWMRGKNKIKDWKACVITWEKKDNERKKPAGKGNGSPGFTEARRSGETDWLGRHGRQGSG